MHYQKRYCTVGLDFCVPNVFMLVTLEVGDDSKLRGYVIRKYLYEVNHLTYYRNVSSKSVMTS